MTTKSFKKPVRITRPLIPDLDKYVKYLKKIMENKWFSNNGQYVLKLEEELKEYLDVKNNAAFCNGTTALMIALKSLNLTDYVITTPFTFPATANVLIWNNLTPIFCDIDYETINITPENVEKYIDIPHTNVTAIIAVHLFGNPCDVYGFKSLANSYDLKIIYDAAHAFGVKYDNIGIGNFGDISMFSFHATKLFHTSEGGMLTYNDDDLDVIIKQYRNFGIKNDDIGSIRPGINGKMNELQAAMGLCILEKVKKEQEDRCKLQNLYYLYLKDIPWIKLLNINVTKIFRLKMNYNYFPIRIIGKSRDEVYEHLIHNNIFPRKYFYPLCSDFPHFRYLRNDLPNAKKVSEEILCLPLYGGLSSEDIEQICSILIEV